MIDGAEAGTDVVLGLVDFTPNVRSAALRHAASEALRMRKAVTD
jgi:hypothetical protein